MTFITYAELGLTPPAETPGSSPEIPGSPSKSPGNPEGGLLHEAHEFMKLWEGFETKVYPDPATNGEPYTVGCGLTYKPDGSKFRLGDVYAADQLNQWAETILARDFIPKHKNWDAFTKGQKMALISFGWNNGAGFVGDYENFASINKMLDSNDWGGAKRIFGLYCKADGKPMLGLQRRRYSEYLLSTGFSVESAYDLASQLMGVV